MIFDHGPVPYDQIASDEHLAIGRIREAVYAEVRQPSGALDCVIACELRRAAAEAPCRIDKPDLARAIADKALSDCHDSTVIVLASYVIALLPPKETP